MGAVFHITFVTCILAKYNPSYNVSYLKVCHKAEVVHGFAVRDVAFTFLDLEFNFK